MLPHLSISILFPAFNEEANLVDCCQLITQILTRCENPFEIIIVDDGSTDNTWDIACSLSHHDPRIKLVRHDLNQGYGAAIRNALTTASMDLVFWTDCDGQIKFEELPTGLSLLSTYDAVIGYRPRRADSFVRRTVSWTGNSINHLRFKTPARDVGCAFKLFYRKHVHPQDLPSNGAMINTQWLQTITRNQRRLTQIPITHHPRTQGKSKCANLKTHWKLFQEWCVNKSNSFKPTIIIYSP